MKIAFYLVLAILLLLVGPLLTLWALNTLFPALAIPYTIWTYLAAAVLQFQLFYKASSSK
jgi:hypothetical protein